MTKEIGYFELSDDILHNELVFKTLPAYPLYLKKRHEKKDFLPCKLKRVVMCVSIASLP